MHLSADDPTALSLLYHLNSEPWLNDAAYAGAGREEALDGLGGEPFVRLPAPTSSPLTHLLARRRSVRAFGPGPLTLAAIADLLAAAQGLVERVEMEEGGTLLRRSAPSAGGLYPLQLHVIARHVEGLPDGLYRHDVHPGTLAELRRGDLTSELAAAVYAFPFIVDANAVFAIVARFRRTQTKYGPRGYRYILLEAGHAAQNLCLRAVELGMATLCIGGFVDSRVNALLGLPQREAGVVYLVAAGNPADA